MFIRDDWTLFRQLETLGQKAGVPKDKIPRLVAKELADNALDVAGSCRFGFLEGGGFFVEDDGDGIPGSDVEIAALFSVARPLVSTKLLRLPTRGALGNGLRVVTGAVLASGGSLEVATGGRRLKLVPQDDGSTSVERLGPCERTGTRVDVSLGSTLPLDADVFEWAKRAVILSAGGPTYPNSSSPFWYDADSFFELCQSAGERSARDLLSALEGCSGSKAGTIAAPFKGRPASSLTRKETEQLLADARAHARPVKPERLGYVGCIDGLPTAHSRTTGTFSVAPARGTLSAELPFLVEAWAVLAEQATFLVHVNRTPITAEITSWHEKNEFNVSGCGLDFGVSVGRRAAAIYLNVQTPYLPITTDGKEPDLSRLEKSVVEVVAKVTRKAKREARAGSNGRLETQKDVILEALPAAIDKASGGGKFRYSQRQLFYAVRPVLLEHFDHQPDYNTFTRVITDHESATGRDLTGIYRDPRGTLYHPHTSKEIPLGTLAVESYRRPAWTFNKILYCEKEGFFPILRDAQWPERHDCALLTAKGFASRAARDVLDLLGDSGEEITVFCIHDADGAGTLIYKALQDGTKARPGRQVTIVNLGLEPEEALAMSLEPERVERKGERRVPVAPYVPLKWRKWLQENRVELNAMTTPEFLAWLDQKIADHENGKLVPPDAVLNEHLERDVRDRLRQRIADRVLAEARVDVQTEDAFRRLVPELTKRSTAIAQHVRNELAGAPANHWTAPVASVADELVKQDPSP